MATFLGNTIVQGLSDSNWSVPRQGVEARRLTVSAGGETHPTVSTVYRILENIITNLAGGLSHAAPK